MKKLPSGISNFEELIMNDYYYVDKTEYIQKLENYPNRNILFLRPRKFGKTLFTSVLENYYDVNKEDKFETLFKDTYIGKQPTKEKNSYAILKFNFSGIDTQSEDKVLSSFKQKTLESIKDFVQRYQLDYLVNDVLEAEELLNSIFYAFKHQKENQKIYVIIDEYDHFANELLGFHNDIFKDLISQNGKIRKWYEILKEGTESVVGRIFITGVAPITLDSMTSGFNISANITKDFEFNNMIGFTKEDIVTMMNEQNISKEQQEMLLPIMKKNYDGYRFSLEVEEKLYNSNMTLYFLNEYVRLGKVPSQLMDVNIASDYTKIANLLRICNGEKKLEILSDTLSDKGIAIEITEKFNPAMPFEEKEMISMLYYLGYLTMDGEEFGMPILRIPNLMMREIYASYFMSIMNEEAEMTNDISYSDMIKELAIEGKISIITNLLKEYLQHLSNRDYLKFDEKYIQLLFYALAMNTKTVYYIKSEPEYERNYPDIMMVPKDRTKDYYSVIIEFKYLKKAEVRQLKKKQQEAREQIKSYAEREEMKAIPHLRKYTVVVVVDEVYVEEIE